VSECREIITIFSTQQKLVMKVRIELRLFTIHTFKICLQMPHLLTSLERQRQRQREGERQRERDRESEAKKQWSRGECERSRPCDPSRCRNKFEELGDLLVVMTRETIPLGVPLVQW
jgi:hypothetical protein